MNKKLIIQIVVIAVAFGASGFVLYNGFFKNSGTPAVLSLTGGAPSTGQDEAILPLGTSLDFSVLKKQNLQFGNMQYPKLDPTTVGIPENQLIKPITP
jgi:hypothetical protein